MAITYRNRPVNAVKYKGKTPYLVEYKGTAYEGYPIAIKELFVDRLFQYGVDKSPSSITIKPASLHIYLNYKKTLATKGFSQNVEDRSPLLKTVYMNDVLTLSGLALNAKGWETSPRYTTAIDGNYYKELRLGITFSNSNLGYPISAKIKPDINPVEGSSEEFVSLATKSSNPIIFGMDNEDNDDGFKIVNEWDLGTIVSEINANSNSCKFRVIVDNKGPNMEVYSYGITYIKDLLSTTGVIHVAYSSSSSIYRWQEIKIQDISTVGVTEVNFFAQSNQNIAPFRYVALFAKKNTLTPISITNKFMSAFNSFAFHDLISFEDVSLVTESSSDEYDGIIYYNDYLSFKLVNKTPFKIILSNVDFGVELGREYEGGYTSYLETPISEIVLDPYDSYWSPDFGAMDFKSDLSDSSVVQNFEGYYSILVSNIRISNNVNWDLKGKETSGRYGDTSYLPLRREF